MKKGLLIAALMCFSLSIVAQEAAGEEWPANNEETAVNDSTQTDSSSNDESLGAHPYDLEQNASIAPEVSHWSLIGHLGFSTVDGDFTSEQKFSVGLPSAGLDLEYAFTPVWGMGLEYMFSWYNVSGNTGHADTLLNGYLHKAGVYLMFDIANLMFPHMERKIVSVQPLIGGGGAWYKRNKFYLDDYYYDAQKGKVQKGTETHLRGNTLNYVNRDGDYQTPDYDTAYNFMPYMQLGVNVDFNINRSLAVGVRAVYSYFTRDYFDGRGANKGLSSHASKNNDGLLDITLNLRYKIQPRKYTHERNIAHLGQNQPEEKAMKKLADAIKNDSVDGGALAALGLGGGMCHDTIIYYRDTVIIRETQTNTFEHIETAKELEQYYYVYFDNNKAIINDEGLITIQQVAERLQEDSSLYAVVTGYCDNTGSDKLNYALGDKRAANVVDELIAEHAIPTDHLYGMGRGKVIGRRSTASYSPNRRASIRLVDKETFDRMRQNLDDQQSSRPIGAADEDYDFENDQPVRTIPLSESARKEKVNVYQQRTNETITTGKSTTLAKLARQYYNNTYCWVYIYVANMDKIKNPNALRPGIDLVIPELTEQEMRITKDEGLVIYNNARQGK